MGELYDLESFRDRRSPAPGRFSSFKPGDVVARNGEVGEVSAYEGVMLGRDVFLVNWEGCDPRSSSHASLRLATAEERAAYVLRRIDEQPEPGFRR